MTEPLPQRSEETAKVGPGHPPVEHRFQPGQSGNPSGRPRGLAAATRDVLQRAVRVGEDPALVIARFWASILGDQKQKIEIRMQAADRLADRGWGKAPQYAPMEDTDPLDFSERDATEAAALFEKRIDELTARRRLRTDASA